MPNTQQQTQTDRFVRGANVGLIGATALLTAAAAETFARLDGWLVSVGALGLALVAYGLGTTMRDRNGDEYTLSLWHAGTSAALCTFILIGFFLPAVMTGLGATGAAAWELRRLPIEWEAVFVCLAFFGAIRWQMGGHGR